jgi:hypothetical protein
MNGSTLALPEYIGQPDSARWHRSGSQTTNHPLEANMSKGSKATSQPEQRDSKGEHGGNRGGDRQKDEEQPKHSSQAAGKDPQRGSKS